MRCFLFGLIVFVWVSGVWIESGFAQVLLREDFADLKNWKPLTFKKIKKHSTYSIIKENGNALLKTESNGSASGIAYLKEFDVYKFQKIKWRWKISNIYKKGNVYEKSGDDYPIRIYVIFKYDPSKAGFFEKAKYNAAKLFYGEYPPHSTLNYVWANRIYSERLMSSPYTNRSKIFPVDMGEENKGIWVNHERNILSDYKEAFQEAPPRIGSLVIMNDSDNTNESSISYIKFIEVSQ